MAVYPDLPELLEDDWLQYGGLFGSITGIDQTLYEAAVLDGATKFQQARYVTLPLCAHYHYDVHSQRGTYFLHQTRPVLSVTQAQLPPGRRGDNL